MSFQGAGQGAQPIPPPPPAGEQQMAETSAPQVAAAAAGTKLNLTPEMIRQVEAERAAKRPKAADGPDVLGEIQRAQRQAGARDAR